jgi:hypothetical protein
MDGEIEHVIEDKNGKRHAVEAKSSEDFYPAKSDDETTRNERQMVRYKTLSQNQSYGVVYKLPKGP